MATGNHTLHQKEVAHFESLVLGTDQTPVAATAVEINRAADVSARVVSCTADTAISEALHEGKTLVANKGDGIAFTLPASTGSGARYRIVIGTAIASNNLTVVVTGNDVFTGHALFDDGDGEPANGWPTAANTNRITMGGSSAATGGTKGDCIELEDIAADTWWVRITGVQGGSEATPFSNV